MGDSQYSFSLTTFSPSGKLVQIEHALTAVGSGQTSLGIKAANGVVIATEKKLPSILVDEASVKKIQSLTPNIGVVYSGMGPDFRVLVRKSRKQAEQYHRLYKEPIPVTQLVRETAAVMQEFTQSGGVRPFGVSLLVAGFDDSGPQLYQVDPSGSYFSWKASAMGKNVSNAKTFLEKRYTNDMELDDAVHTAILTLKEGFEGQISGKNIEIGIIGTDKKFRVLTPAEIEDYLAEVDYIFIGPRICSKSNFRWKTKSSIGGGAVEKSKRDGLYIDKRGKFRSFNNKKMSRKRCGSLRGRGWKYGSGFVDGVFPVMSPTGQKILDLVQKEVDKSSIWEILDTLPASHTIWDDIINVAVQLRLNKQWGSIILICEWILYKSSFKPDVICYNLLLDAYGQKSQHKAAESTYLELLEARCIPTEDTYALLLRAYCKSGLLDKAEAVFGEMRKYGLPPSAIVFDAYINGLIKGGNPQKALEIFQRMKRDQCQPSTDTYTTLINLYGKERKSYMALKLFHEMRSQKCKPNICTYTALVNAFAREGLCEKAEEIFEQMQEAGHEPDVYAYNALMEAYSRAGFPYGAAEIFSLMQHMGCEPDRASYNIMVDAYGRAGLHEDAEVAFEEMKRLGITPTVKSHMLLLSAYSKAGNVTKCEDIVNQMQKSGLELDTFVINSMLNLYGRLGQLKKMEEVLTAMEKGPYAADISTYNILINIYGRAGFFEKMEELFQSLPTKNLKPDVVTWTSRLGAYSRKKLYKRCLEIFEEMIDAGCYPDGGTAKVLLGACSSEDQTEQVSTVIRTMHKDIGTVLPI
ncbi:PREDICTED: proteasome [Prunus dulcis]|uniref:PREDICTED: proteasome n=1 Tax=Prunus dulcis TaxID=3755 RepID=A0A5E4FGI2_PRUDU|nr:PREDICTED: proteasome [Prunus dulcis]